MSFQSRDDDPDQTTGVTFTAEPFTTQPLIADILRTRYCVSGSIFLVEGIDIIPTPKSTRWRAIRLLLGDGELCIQALLSGELHRYVDGKEIGFGTYIKLERFRLESRIPDTGVILSRKGKENPQAPSLSAHKMVYLIVEDLVVVGWNNQLLRMPEDHQMDPILKSAPKKDERTVPATINSIGHEHSTTISSGSPEPTANTSVEVAPAEDDFEVMTVAEQKATQRRADIAVHTSSFGYSKPTDPSHLPWSSTDPSKPLKLTPLRAIPNLPYKQNWSTNILAIVASISDLEPSNLPPFKQRQARLTDPSTSKHVHLTVFLDPEEFAPSVGSVVLLLGVKNHRFDAGSLKKYASDRSKNGTRWWYENPTQFSWCDVVGLKQWWDRQSKSGQARLS